MVGILGLDDLDGHLAAHGRLIRPVYDPKSAGTDLFLQLVTSDLVHLQDGSAKLGRTNLLMERLCLGRGHCPEFFGQQSTT